MDPVTLKMVKQFDILDIVQEICGPISIAPSTKESFQYRWENYNARAGVPYMSLYLKDGKPYREDITIEQLSAVVDSIERDLEWIDKNTGLVFAESSGPAPDGMSELLKEVSDHFLDSIIVAQQSGLLLVSEDYSYRQIGKDGYGVNGTWIQPILMVALDHGKISLDRYTKTTIGLAHAGHSFLSINSHVLRVALTQSRTAYRAVAKYLFGAAADFKTHVNVMLQFLLSVWDTEHPSPDVLQATGIMLDRFCRGEWLQRLPNVESEEILEVLLVQLGDHPLAGYARNWAKGHLKTRRR